MWRRTAAGMWRRGGDWWVLWTESRVVCAAAPAAAPLGPPSRNTPHAGFGAEVATGETGTPAPASASVLSAEAPPANCGAAVAGAAAAGAPDGTPPARAPSDSAAGADCDAAVAAGAADGAPPARASSASAAGADCRGGAALASIAIGFCLSVAGVSRCGAGVSPPPRRAGAAGAAAANRPATWRVLMPVACSISSRWRCGCSSGAADDGPVDSSANGSSRNDSGASEAVCSDSDGATTGTGTGTGTDADADADAGRSVGGRSCGARPSSDDGAAGPATARRFHSTPAAAAARRHAWRRGPAQQRGSPPAPRARSPPPHHRSTRRPAVQAPAPIGARAPLAHPLRPALPAAQAAWFGQRNRDPDRGSDPDRRSGARYGTGARPARHRQRWFPIAPPRSYSTRRFAGWPAPTDGAGTAASPGCAAARRRRCSATPAPRSRTGSRTRAAAPDRGGRSRRDGPGCALRCSADWRPGVWSDRGAADRPAR